MKIKFFSAILLFLPFTALAQEEAVTASGKTVILFPDSTWKLKVEQIIASNDSTSLAPDSLTTSAPVKPKKEYDETLTGFKGFLKPEPKVFTLPEQSDGTYQFRVKINKEGFVKEIIPVVVGPNGMAQQVMRDAILKLKFMPQGIPVPPLTEGMIKIVVPAAKP